MVAEDCNLSYLRGVGRKIKAQRPPQAKSRSYLKNNFKQKVPGGEGGGSSGKAPAYIAQGLEIKLQHCLKQNREVNVSVSLNIFLISM
jgi:hypothetical protein